MVVLFISQAACEWIFDILRLKFFILILGPNQNIVIFGVCVCGNPTVEV